MIETSAGFQSRIEQLEARLEEAEATLDAIRNGEVDAVVMRDGNGERVYTLAGAEQPYRLLIEAMQQGAATLATDGTILYCNRSFASMIRRPQEQLIGSSVQSLFLAGGSPSIMELLHGGADGNGPANGHGRESTELFLAHESGEPTQVSVSVGTLQLHGHEAIFLLLRDLTEHKQHEMLKETDRRKDEFLAMLAHELRNPLAPIASAVAMLNICNDSQNPTIQAACDIVQRQTHQLTRIVDDLLDVSRITRGIVVLKKSPQDVCSLVADAVETSRPLIAARNHSLHIDLPSENLTINGDYARLSQVLANILNNAAKYTDTGGDIWVSVEAQDKEVRIAIRDTGVGIHPELLPKIFDMFTQAERSIDRSQGGLGIGLTIARRIVALHNGRINVRSDGPGKGSEFAIYLPLLKKSRAIAAPARLDPRVEGSPKRILIVDDNRDAADGMAMLLEFAGQTARTVYDGAAAIDVVEEFKPDLVLLDLGLPGMDGFAVARHLRQKSQHVRNPGHGRKVVLAALTGYGDAEDRRRTAEAGFDYHYVKPLDFSVLTEMLGKI